MNEELATLAVLGLLLTELYVTYRYEYCAHHEPVACVRLRETICSSTPTLFRLAVLSLQALLLIHHHGLYRLAFYVYVVTASCAFFPYLRKASPYLPHCHHGGTRDWSDSLVWTSLVYLAAGGVALCNEEYPIAFLCAVTAAGSALYHRHREGQFFNLDNVFATAQLVVFFRAFYDSYDKNLVFFLVSAVGFPVPFYLLRACGDPADIVFLQAKQDEERESEAVQDDDCFSFLRERHAHPVVRRSRPSYETLHLCWHVTSALGPFLSMIYLAHHRTPPMLDLSPWGIADKEVLAVVGLTVSVIVNVAANAMSAVPFH